MKSKLIYDYIPCIINFEKSMVFLPEDVKLKIKKNWEDLYRAGKRYVNGQLYTIDSIGYENMKLKLNVKTTTYDYYLYSLERKFIGQYICRSLASNVLIITSDNYYVLAKMSERTSLPNKIKFIGGALSEDDLINNQLDLLKCIERETFEELGITLENNNKVVSIKPRYFITRENLSFINTLFIANLDISREDILDLFNTYKEKAKNSEFELKSIIFVKNNAITIKSFIEDNREILIDYMEELFYTLIGDLEPKNILSEIGLSCDGVC